MIDLRIIGYTVEHFESTLTPDVLNMADDPVSRMELHCNSTALDDKSGGMLRCVITVSAANDEQAEPFARIDGAFNFLFGCEDESDPDAINDALRITGIEIALAVIRGLITGATGLFSLPSVFDFPHIDVADISWEDYKEENQ